jgi:hypothetical protein
MMESLKNQCFSGDFTASSSSAAVVLAEGSLAEGSLAEERYMAARRAERAEDARSPA